MKFLIHTHSNYLLSSIFKGVYIYSIVVFKTFLCGWVIIGDIRCAVILDI